MLAAKPASTPCWPEFCSAVVAFQRGQGVNMNPVGPFRGQGYFCLLPAERPATLLPMATHRRWRDRDRRSASRLPVLSRVQPLGLSGIEKLLRTLNGYGRANPVAAR
ncbi:MAG: hypothetical protein EBU75_07055 [Betaproteobacteria bacterium]|nr:hypothetical protein [Betaproteobacteria bacterium]